MQGPTREPCFENCICLSLSRLRFSSGLLLRRYTIFQKVHFPLFKLVSIHISCCKRTSRCVSSYSGLMVWRNTGHWGYGGSGKAGATYYYIDADVGYTITPNTNWVVACGRNVVGSGKVGTIINGATTSTANGGTGNCDLSIGSYCTTNTCNGPTPETSDW